MRFYNCNIIDVDFEFAICYNERAKLNLKELIIMVKQDQKVSLKIGHELLEKLEQLAVKNDRTLSSMIRIILKEYIERGESYDD